MLPRESARINLIGAADKWTDNAGDRTQIIRELNSNLAALGYGLA